jgi:large subunit ribosomal protein L4e
MKATLYNFEGKKKSEIELPKLFSFKVREDVVAKLHEAEKSYLAQSYSPDPKAGKKHSASGTISHKRHDWKGHYGRGISRVPRKTMWRRGTNFYWIGAEISSTRGGRRAHPPKLGRRLRKINKKEIKLAFNSAIAATSQEQFLIKRYSSLSNLKIKLPLIIESNLDKIKSKDLNKLIKIILNDLYKLATKTKSIRPGKGKLRGRKYKSNAGLLIVKSKDESFKSSSFDIKNPEELLISDLYPLGRLTLFTEKALKELER